MLFIDDLELRLDATRVWFMAEGERHEARLATVGEERALAALAGIQSSLDAGITLADAITAAEAVQSPPRHMQLLRHASGATILNDAHGADRNDMASALRSLVQLLPSGSRSVAVLGEFDSAPRDFVEEHDAIGRLIVRLNVGKLVAVGHGARHLQSAAGLEGSWDGESLIVDTADEAYALLRDEIRGNDLVLVKGATGSGLGDLGDRLGEAAAWLL